MIFAYIGENYVVKRSHGSILNETIILLLEGVKGFAMWDMIWQLSMLFVRL